MFKLKYRILPALLLGAATMFTACDLDTAPTSSVGSDEAMGTVRNAYSALNGIAKCMTVQHAAYGQGFAGENAIYRLYESMPSQNWNYNYYAPGWSVIHNQQFHMQRNSRYCSYAWYYYYGLIVQANAIINKVDNAEGDEADKKFIKAAALTFRAYSFEKLTRYYCYRWQDSNNGASAGMILRLDESTDDMARSTLAETFAQIYKDCEDAISLFTESGVERSNVWIPNVNVAHAVYARAALDRQDYSTALEQAKLAEEGYPLMSNAEYWSGFCAPTSEWIFGSYGGSTEQNWYWAFGVQGACNGYYATTQPTGAGTIGHELISRIPNNDARKQLFITEDKFSSIDITDDNQVNQTYGILGLGDDNVWLQADSICQAHSVSGLTAPYQSGYMYLDGQLKFWVTDQPGVSYLPFIRTSEMVLIEAEANYFLGNTADAQAALVKLNASSGRNPEYTCTKTGEDLFNEIKDYRELELWCEGFAWSDYKRWNLPVVRHTFAEGGNAHPAVAVTINPEDANKWTWVVPDGESNFNDKAITDSTSGI